MSTQNIMTSSDHPIKRCAVIMAGGSGERFYPLSRRVKPKQLLPLVRPDKSMIEEAIDRVQSIIQAEDVYVITSAVLQEAVRAALPQIPPENIIAEPYKRNTAPCLALAASVLIAKYKGHFSADQLSVAVLTADQFIADTEVFAEQVDQCLTYAEAHPVLLTLGIPPVRPETGYGYIELGEARENDISSVKCFREKPDAATALSFVESGRFLWNSGMFFYRCDTFVQGLLEHCVEVGQHIDAMSSSIHNEVHTVAHGSYPSIDEVFETMPDISVDYALMERASNVCVLPSRFAWDDVGSWDSLDRTNEHDDNDNVCVGTTTVVESHHSIIANYSTNQQMMLSVIGLENVVVIATDDSIVVCPKDRVQEVKKAVALMKERKQHQWL